MGLGPRRKQKVAEAQDRWDPEADEDAFFSHAPEPEGN